MPLVPSFLPPLLHPRRPPRPAWPLAGGFLLSAGLLLGATAFSAAPAAGASEPDAKPSRSSAASASTSPAKPPESPTAKLIKSLHWREIGPYRGGRSDAVTGVPGDRSTYYFGATGGGVWKTVNAGNSAQRGRAARPSGRSRSGQAEREAEVGFEPRPAGGMRPHDPRRGCGLPPRTPRPGPVGSGTNPGITPD